MMFCIENNQYGMGTSVDRHSSVPDYYQMGNKIPGLRIDGMNVLAVREGIRFAKEYCGAGHGPIYLEMMTYRYHGHSMSDPGNTYRDRKEIEEIRRTRDPLKQAKDRLQEAGFMTLEEIKETEKRIRNEVYAEVKKAKMSSPPGLDQLAQHIYAAELEPGKQAYPDFVRMPDFAKSMTYNTN